MRARRTVAGLLAVAALGIAAAGCGSDSSSGDSGAPASTTATQVPPVATTAPSGGTTAPSSGGSGDTAAGKGIFTSNCAGCHALSDAGAAGAVGPNLDEVKPDEATVKNQVINGGGGMPAFKDTLSDQEIADVSAYVAQAAGG